MQSVLITGVSSGLGRALALRAHQAGWRVYGTTRQDRPAADYGLPDEVTLLRLELRFPHAIGSFADRFLAEYGAPDMLINNAAEAWYGAVEETEPGQLRELFQVNVFAAVELTTALLPRMRERGSGTIANITSLGGRMVFPFFTAYNASKHALEGFSEGLWHEVRPFGIRVKAIEPGYVATPIYDVMAAPIDDASPYARAISSMTEFGNGVRRRTSPDEAAREVWRAATDASNRLRYPVAAYARMMLALRAILGSEWFIRLMHGRWVGGRH